MANDVFANGREVACKAADGKSICAFPDVCMTPPENPATPPGVPVPYPNTGFARDTADGSRTVRISGKEVMLKNKSHFKTSTGDEAGCAAKKGVVTSTNRGKVYFVAWSGDVRFEGENACRHLDMTTHNHASPMANEAAPMVYVDTMGAGGGGADGCRQFVPEGIVQCPANGKEHSFECESHMCGGCVQPPTEECKEAAKRMNAAAHEETKNVDRHKARLAQAEAKEHQAVKDLEGLLAGAKNARDEYFARAGTAGSGGRRAVLEGRQAAAQSRMASIREQISGARGRAEGTTFERVVTEDVVGSDPSQTVRNGSYRAHCTVCHLTAELDLVTDDAVIESKVSIAAVDADQLRERILPVAKKCHPGKKVVYHIGSDTPTTPSKKVQKNLGKVDPGKRAELVKRNIEEQRQAAQRTIETKMNDIKSTLSPADAKLVDFKIVPF